MEDRERDSTQDWLLPGHSLPPSLAELEGRIDEALTTAKASEAAIVSVGEAALDAAVQARRAAGLAERAAKSAADAQRRIAAAPAPPKPTAAAPGDDSLRDFSERADRIMARLREIERLPARPASGAAGRS